MRLVLRLRDHTARLAGVRQGPVEQVDLVIPGRTRQLHPVPLDLLTGLVDDLDRGPVTAPARARLATRPQPPTAHFTGEGDVALLVAERADLVVKRAGPDVRVLAQPLGDVR